MANNKKATRRALQNLQCDLGPKWDQSITSRRHTQTPEEAARSSTPSGPSHNNNHTPDSTRLSTPRQRPSSRDSTPHQHNRARSKSQGTQRHSFTREGSTPNRSPGGAGEAITSRGTPKPQQQQQQQPDNIIKTEPVDRDVIMSQRNRSGRGSNRNNGNAHGEEVQIWESCREKVAELVAGVNEENDSLAELVKMDKQVGAMPSEKIPGDALQQMEQLCRTGVKFSDGNAEKIKSLLEQLKVLRAVVVAKEQAEAQLAGPAKRTAARDSAATAASSLYDFDGAGDSPVPSPIGGSSRKFGDRSSNRDRDSMPPKADSVEPQGPGGGASALASAAANARSKVLFSKGDPVAFKPRPINGDQTTDWILGEVAQVLGEGKSRRYKVLDIEPEDQSKQKEYRSSASSMIPITPESQASTLKDWEPGKVVLALYPNTTTFYKAEVHSTDGDGKVNLRFEGENDSTTLQQVERRFVIEYRA